MANYITHPVPTKGTVSVPAHAMGLANGRLPTSFTSTVIFTTIAWLFLLGNARYVGVRLKIDTNCIVNGILFTVHKRRRSIYSEGPDRDELTKRCSQSVSDSWSEVVGPWVEGGSGLKTVMYAPKYSPWLVKNGPETLNTREQPEVAYKF